jgi:hypothetical protein
MLTELRTALRWLTRAKTNRQLQTHSRFLGFQLALPEFEKAVA